jgi:hypothetical protein
MLLVGFMMTMMMMVFVVGLVQQGQCKALHITLLAWLSVVVPGFFGRLAK